MRKLLYIVVTCFLFFALIPCGAHDQEASAFIIILKPYSNEQNFSGVTRGQFLRRGSHSFYWQSISNDSLNNLIKDLEPIDTLPYGSDTPAMKWMADGDSIIYLKYLGRPVLGQIIYYTDTTYNRYKPIDRTVGWKKPEIIWIGKNYIDIDTLRYVLPNSLINYLNGLTIKNDGPTFGD